MLGGLQHQQGTVWLTLTDPTCAVDMAANYARMAECAKPACTADAIGMAMVMIRECPAASEARG
jgi:hypothetical protein